MVQSVAFFWKGITQNASIWALIQENALKLILLYIMVIGCILKQKTDTQCMYLTFKQSTCIEITLFESEGS